MTNAKFLKLNWEDLLNGAVVAAGTLAAAIVLPSIESGQLPSVAKLKLAGIAAACGFIGYLLKNLFTNSKDKLFQPEPVALTVEQSETDKIIDSSCK